MLQEIASTHRTGNRKPKRWFTDSNMDLFVWFIKQRPVCFQFSYNKLQQEHSICWHVDSGFSHTIINPGNRHIKYSASTSPSEQQFQFDATIIAREFLLASGNIAVTLADFIFARLLEAPAQLEAHSNPVPVSKNL